MATARDVVTWALEDRKTIGVGASPTAREMAYGVRRLNDMLSAWALDGIDLGHVTVAEADTLDFPDDHLRTIRLNLALNLAALPGGVGEADYMAAEAEKAALRGIYFSIGELSVDRVLAGPADGLI